MKVVTVSGPPSSGKTSIAVKAMEHFRAKGFTLGAVKFDCVSSFDEATYKSLGIPVKAGLSGHVCPDHFFVSNLYGCFEWGIKHDLHFLFTETAGLCNRCAPHMRGVLAVCVIDNLSGVNTPWKIGPMLRLADIVVITKGDIVSQAEREVFLFRTRQVNPRAVILHVNGLTGQGSAELAALVKDAKEMGDLEGARLRTSMPAAVCSYCLGQTRVSEQFQMGNIRRLDFSLTEQRPESTDGIEGENT